jgi:hypothetical protein
MPAKIPSMFPSAGWPISDYLYLVGFDSGIIKVGRTSDPHRRFTTHRVKQRYGAMAWVHLFGGRRSGGAEQSAIYRMASVGERLGKKEAFTGLSKGQAIACCRGALASQRQMDEQRAKWEREAAAGKHFFVSLVGRRTEVA